MITLKQHCSNHSLSGTTVAKSFPASLTQGSGVLAAVTWIDPNSNANPYPTITVADAIGSYSLLASMPLSVGLGGDVWTGVFFARYRNAGALGNVTATSTAGGVMFISLHEVAPNSGEILIFDDWGRESAIGFATTYGDGTNAVGVFAPQGYNQSEYEFVVWATRDQTTTTVAATGGSPTTLQEYESNAVATGTLGVTGAQATFDKLVNQYGGGLPGANHSWSFAPGTGNVAAVIVLIASIPAVADIPTTDHPTGEYAGSQTVTLAQAESFDIHYTTDGSTPTSGSTLYSVPFTVATPETVKAIAIQPSGGGGFYPPGLFANSSVPSWVLDIFTGTCANPAFVIDGNDTTFAELDANGSTGDIVAVKAYTGPAAITGAPGTLNVFYEVTQNDLVAALQTLPAWKIVGTVAGVDTIMASGVKGAGVVAPTTATLAVPAGTHVDTLKAIVFAICQVPGSTGGVKIKIYGAWLQVT